MNEIIKGMGFHHIALRCKDIDKSIEFYKAIGCVVTTVWGTPPHHSAMVDIGDGGRIELFSGGVEETTESDTRSGEWLHLAVTSDDPDAAFATAIAAGATEKFAPYDAMLSSDPPMPLRIAFVYGPDKEVIEFFHVKEQA
ncbi:MAG: VOC family protein [Oscillospiraceae bacterium]|nr:VOC family protein [Oscillospiraceae bacterium]